MVYADFETMLAKTDGCDDNPHKYFTNEIRS